MAQLTSRHHGEEATSQTTNRLFRTSHPSIHKNGKKNKRYYKREISTKLFQHLMTRRWSYREEILLFYYRPFFLFFVTPEQKLDFLAVFMANTRWPESTEFPITMQELHLVTARNQCEWEIEGEITNKKKTKKKYQWK
jgi:hypothetical protein